MKQISILLIEDEPGYQILIKAGLQDFYDLHIAKSGSEAKELLATHQFSLILLDLVLPDTDGYQFCLELRQNKQTADIPIFILTSKGTDTEKVLGFSSGADDYLVKPFSLLELQARIQSKFKKISSKTDLSVSLTSGIFQVNQQTKRVFVTQGALSEEIHLTTLEFKLFNYFLNHPDHVLSRNQILDAIWGNSHVNERTVDTHISKLRQKLNPFASCILSMHGSGYRYVIPQSIKKLVS